MYIAMSFAILAKGPIGVLLPCTIIGLLLLVTRRLNELDAETLTAPSGPWWQNSFVTVAQVMRPTRIWEASWRMRVVLGAAVVLAIALPWYVAVGLKMKPDSLKETVLEILLCLRDGQELGTLRRPGQ